MMIVGADFEDGEMGGDDWSDSTDASFEFLSIHTITAFVMMFGWSGLTCYLQFQMGANQSLIIAFIVGLVAMLITADLFVQAKKLVSRGADFKISDLVGMNAQVYQTIPVEGVGKITVSMAGKMTREVDAISADKVNLKSFQTVKIVEVIDANTVSVRKI